MWTVPCDDIHSARALGRPAAGRRSAFYEAAFGARVVHRVGDGDDIVAQLAIGDARVLDRGHRFEHRSGSVPQAIGGATGRVLLVVDDPDAVFAQAVAAGAQHQVTR